MKKILGIGNALVDALYQIKDETLLNEMQLPKGSMQLIDTGRYTDIGRRMKDLPVKLATGGSACNTILALANMGMKTGLIGKIADDEPGRFFENKFRQLGTRTYLQHEDLPTGVASTFITPDGQRTFGTYLGAAACLRPEDLREEWFGEYDYLYIEGYLVQNHALIERAVDMAREADCRVCLDMASYNIVEAEHDFFTHLLKKTDMVFANEEEARAFTGNSPREALDELAGICEVAVVKTGAAGAMACSGDEGPAAVAAVPVDHVTDTTAAGDFFASGFLYAHAHRRPLADCLRAGTLLAAEVIQVVGTQLSEDSWNGLRNHPGLKG